MSSLHVKYLNKITPYFIIFVLQGGDRVTGTIGAFSQELDSLTVSDVNKTVIIASLKKI